MGNTRDPKFRSIKQKRISDPRTGGICQEYMKISLRKRVQGRRRGRSFIASVLDVVNLLPSV